MKRVWVLKKYEALTKLGLSRARAVELLSQYSGYARSSIYDIVQKCTKGVDSELISEKTAIKIEPEIAAKVKQLPITDVWKDVELLSEYSGYHKEHIRKIVKSANAEEEADSEFCFRKRG